MKKKNMIIAGALLLTTLTVTSCHEEADTLVTYAYDDAMAFRQAEKSYAGKFRVFWNAMNQNYLLWDFEKENGLDWDAIYDEYLPKFEALDKPGTQVSDSLLRSLLDEMVAPLHDGHMYVKFKNHQTNNYVMSIPGITRYFKRPDFEETNHFDSNLSGYEKAGLLKRHLAYGASAFNQLYRMLEVKGVGRQWVKTRIEELRAKSSLTERELMQYEGLCALDDELEDLLPVEEGVEFLNNFNSIVDKYSYLKVPFLEKIDPRFNDYPLALQFAQTKDDIVYLQMSQFGLTTYLHDASFKEALGGVKRNEEIRQHVVQIWQAWFDAIQDLHKSGKLRGVIIDVRNNPGGMTYDANYVLGALLPSGGQLYGWARFKRGVGRYDYSPLMPMHMPTMDAPHEVIDDKPIVILANARSVSMSEITTLSAKQVKNAIVIGRRTYGGLCGLLPNKYNTENYSGHIGVEGTTPVYVYTPTVCVLDMDKKSLDGIGIEPDIEVGFDYEEFERTGMDSQFDRALEYIRTGK